jgi:hypothetical protein
MMMCHACRILLVLVGANYVYHTSTHQVQRCSCICISLHSHMDTHFDPDNPYHVGVHDSPQRTNRTNKEEQAINAQTKRSTPRRTIDASPPCQFQWNRNL